MFSGVAAQSDGSGVFVGQSARANGDAWAVRLDANGEILWQHSFGGTHEDLFSNAAPMKNGDIVIAGGFGIGEVWGRNRFDAWFVRLNENGEIVREHKHKVSEGAEINGLTPLSDGGVVLAGRAIDTPGFRTGFAMRLDGEFKAKWTLLIDGDIHRNSELHGVAVLPNGQFLLAGTAPPIGDGLQGALMFTLRPDGTGHQQGALSTAE